MIDKIECVTLSCDNCQKDFENYNGFTVFLDANTAIDEASNDDWYQDGNKHYCPDCYTLDDDDKLILKEIKKITDDFWVECNVCKQQLKNWVGSTPCCGSIAFKVEDGVITKKVPLFGSINNQPIEPIELEIS